MKPAAATTRLALPGPGPGLGPSYGAIPTVAAAGERRRGLALAALSAAAFAAMAVLVRTLSDGGFTALQTMFWRSAVQAAAAAGACGAAGARPLAVLRRWRQLRWVLVRAVFGGIGHVLYYAALGAMPLGPATVLFFTNPVFTALLAHWLLGEPFAARHRALMAASLLGIALVAVRPAALLGVGPLAAAGSLCALGGAAAVALAYVSIRIAGRRVHAMVHVVYFGVVGALGSLALGWARGEAWRLPGPAAGEWAAVVGVGLTAFAAQFLMNRGLQLAPAGPVVMMRNSDIVIGFLADAVIYRTVPGVAATVGAVIITASVIAIAK
ncbi:hypothetical protein H4R18_003048 [Coemansia javaensis]|uniref:EamA domain-containing protein n=1 Tax=Coemansia javaensis TaxID=2761396 RepID=A0A9W8HD63_9FUNG|nr:hypothetical protein H4R18_003048 [Coemansia javaensis]